MRLLTKYILKQFCVKTIGVLVVLVLLKSFIDLGGELSDIGKGSYTALTACGYIALGSGADMYQFFPISVLLGSLIALGSLAQHNELMVMRASGVASSYLMAVIALGVLIMALFVSIIGQLFSPYLVSLGNQIKTRALTGGSALNTTYGLWLRSGDDFFYIQKVDELGNLNGILRYQFDKNRNLQSISYAKQANYDNDHWQFHDVLQSRLTGNTVEMFTYPSIDWSLAFKPELLALSHKQPNEKTLFELYKQIRARRKNNLQSNRLAFNFWQRVYQPVSSIAMLMLVLPFIFGSLSHTYLGVRLVTGALVGIAYYLVEHFLGPLSMVYQIPAYLAAFIPIAAVLILSLLLWRYIR